jgi:hypothetical protein
LFEFLEHHRLIKQLRSRDPLLHVLDKLDELTEDFTAYDSGKEYGISPEFLQLFGEGGDTLTRFA